MSLLVWYFLQALWIFVAAIVSWKRSKLLKAIASFLKARLAVEQNSLISPKSTISSLYVSSTCLLVKLLISEFRLRGINESSSRKKLVQLSFFIVLYSLRHKLGSESRLSLPNVPNDCFFGSCFSIERDLQETGLRDFDLSFSCSSLSYLNCFIKHFSLGG